MKTAQPVFEKMESYEQEKFKKLHEAVEFF